MVEAADNAIYLDQQHGSLTLLVFVLQRTINTLSIVMFCSIPIGKSFLIYLNKRALPSSFNWICIQNGITANSWESSLVLKLELELVSNFSTVEWNIDLFTKVHQIVNCIQTQNSVYDNIYCTQLIYIKTIKRLKDSNYEIFTIVGCSNNFD